MQVVKGEGAGTGPSILAGGPPRRPAANAPRDGGADGRGGSSATGGAGARNRRTVEARGIHQQGAFTAGRSEGGVPDHKDPTRRGCMLARKLQATSSQLYLAHAASTLPLDSAMMRSALGGGVHSLFSFAIDVVLADRVKGRSAGAQEFEDCPGCLSMRT